MLRLNKYVRCALEGYQLPRTLLNKYNVVRTRLFTCWRVQFYGWMDRSRSKYVHPLWTTVTKGQLRATFVVIPIIVFTVTVLMFILVLEGCQYAHAVAFDIQFLQRFTFHAIKYLWDPTLSYQTICNKSDGKKIFYETDVLYGSAWPRILYEFVSSALGCGCD